MNTRHLRLLTAALLGAMAAMPLSAAESSNRYDTGFATMQRIAVDLHRALAVEKRGELATAPVLLENRETPYLKLERAGSNDSQVVFVSQGLIDVLNYVSHAKAVDQVDSGSTRKRWRVLRAKTQRNHGDFRSQHTPMRGRSTR